MKVAFTLSGADINYALLEKIKNLIQGNAQDFEVFIRVKSKETQETSRKRLEERMLEMERGENVVKFTSDEFDGLVKQLSKRCD